jgi:hypothetical protein
VNWLVVWEDTSLWYYGNGSFNIRGAIVTRSGSTLVVDSSFQINDPASTGKRYPTVATDNTTYLVAWEDTATADLHGKLVSTSGSAGSQFTVASDSYNTLKYPAAAGRAITEGVGQGFVVVWEDRPYTGSDPANIRGVPVSNTGQVGTKAFISSGSAGETGPAIASNGGDSYLVAWTDERNSTLDIYASRVNVVSGSPDTLSILDSSGLAINTDVSAQTKVAIGITRPYEPYAVAYDHAPAGLTAIRVNLVTP